MSYSSEGFLECNLDSLNPDFISLLHGSLAGASDGAEGAGSANPFVKGLFSAKAITTQAHPKNEDTIVSAQQPVKPMHTPSTCRKGTVKRMAMLCEDSAIEEQEWEDDDTPNSSSGLMPCVAGEFRAALGTLFETLSEMQSWFVFCMNPNDLQLPNQLEGWSIKGQIQSLGLTEVSKRNVNIFEVGLTLDEFHTWYGEPMAKMGMMDGSAKEKVEQTRNILGLQETDIVLGQYKVFLSQAAFHSLKDQAEAGLDVHSIGDPYAPYASPGLPPNDYTDPYNQVSSQAHVPLVANASPFQRGNLYKDDYEDCKSFRSDDFDNRSRLTSNREEINSNYGSKSYTPSRNMFQNTDKEGLIAKEALPVAGEIMENETIEVVKETLAHRRWVLLCWLLTWWIPSIFLKWLGWMKHKDFALNVIIWFICACVVFIIAVLGVVICPTEHVFSTSELALHSFSNSANNVYTAIRGEVFDLTQVALTHQRVVSIIPTKSILQYGSQDATNLFPVSALCNGVSGSVSPWVQLSAVNTTDLNAQYHDFCAVSNDSHPDWYFESMTIMHWNNHVGYMGYTPQEISSMANTNGRTLGIYDGLIYDLTEYVNFSPSVQGPHGEVAPSVDSQFMDSTLVNLFKYSSGQVLTKAINNSTLTLGCLPHRRHASTTYSSLEW
ncbi:P-loop containing nucleoside triphosphate hydrolase protein [Boletus edulis BED1]|uniref:P-loop containing nucleoside triphosphate hydrolase protein n=1 Tax=Boletus edulis BED1 TaxID=1328754 RepID=A0AAD4GDF9_BOLED|nr:P-loop containing nucleoside triphosphate hydrolase protein [Boletus edulis BED1]